MALFAPMRTARYLLLLLLWSATTAAWAQPTDTVPKPPPVPAQARPAASGWPNPKKAVLWGIIPGGGQVYNRDWWKLPIVYGGLGALTYIYIDNRNEYRRLRDNYRLQVDDDPNTNPSESPYDQIDPISMKTYRDQWRRYSELSALFLGLGYIFSIGEAFVDAQLKNFDVSDDLSFRLRAVPGTQGYPVTTIGLCVPLNRKRKNNVYPWAYPSPQQRASTP